eukprot:763330-Hanusia_phi.AAC.3
MFDVKAGCWEEVQGRGQRRPMLKMRSSFYGLLNQQSEAGVEGVEGRVREIWSRSVRKQHEASVKKECRRIDRRCKDNRTECRCNREDARPDGDGGNLSVSKTEGRVE